MNRPGLAYWYDQLYGRGDYPEEAVTLMTQQPGFEEACVACAQGNLGLRAPTPALMRAFRDSSRTFYAMFALILDASGPVTLSTLQALAAELGFASRGRAAAMMMYLRMIGYLERSPEQTNRRSISFVASPKLIAVHDRFMQNELAAAAIVEPDAQVAVSRLTEPAFRRAHLRVMGMGLKRLLLAPKAATTTFAERDAGLAILYQIALSGDVYPARGPVRLNLSEMARYHGVSRAHVTRLLRDAAHAGLLNAEADGMWSMAESLRNALSRLHAFSFAAHCAMAYGAMRIVGEGNASDNGRTSGGHTTSVLGKAAAPPDETVVRN